MLVAAVLVLGPILAGGPRPAQAAAIALVQKGASVQTGSTSVTPSLPAPSTAGNLLVAILQSSSTTTAFSAPSGWLQAADRVSGSATRVAIFYRPNTPGGITSATFTSGLLASVAGELSEYRGADPAAPLDKTGNAASTGTSSLAVSTSAATVAPGDVGVTAFSQSTSLANTKTFTAGSGWTKMASQGGSVNRALTGDYRLGLPPAVASETETSNRSGNWAGAIATFRLPCTGGTLAVTPPGSIAIGTFGLTGSNQTVARNVPLTATDLTGSLAGWNLSLSTTQFTNARGRTLPANAASVTSGSASAASGTCTLPTNSVTYPVRLSTTPAKVFNAAATTPGTGPVNVTLGSQLAIPATAYNGAYSSTWTFTIASGP